jgi:hypothetical protein
VAHIDDAAEEPGRSGDHEPLTWLHLLEEKVSEQKEHAETYDAYYSNEREIELIKREYQDVFGANELEPPRTNLSAVGVNAVAERLRIDGFRVGDEDNQAGADEASEIWRRNDLDVMHAVAHVETFVKARTFGLCWPDRSGKAVITIEDPEQFAVARRPEPPYDVIAAAKFYTDDWGVELAVLWLMEGMYKYRSGGGSSELWTPPGGTSRVPSKWRPRDRDAFTPAPTPWRNKRVPVVEHANRQRLIKEPSSDLVDVAPLADSHAKVLADLIIACSFGAVPIRTATGLKLLRNPDDTLKTGPDGRPLSPFDVRADRAMVSENENAKFGTLPAADLAGYVSALEQILANVRIVTRVPAHYYGEGTSSGLAGETIKASEASLVRRVNGTHDPLGMSWRTLLSIALQLESDANADAPVSVRWADTETRVEAQLIDGGTKLEAMGVPLEIVLTEHLKMDRATVKRAMDLREEERARGEDILRALEADVARPDRATTAAAEPDGDELKKLADAFGTLYRSGVPPREAARIVGLDLKAHSGLLPVTLQDD